MEATEGAAEEGRDPEMPPMRSSSEDDAGLGHQAGSAAVHVDSNSSSADHGEMYRVPTSGEWHQQVHMGPESARNVRPPTSQPDGAPAAQRARQDPSQPTIGGRPLSAYEVLGQPKATPPLVQ